MHHAIPTLDSDISLKSTIQKANCKILKFNNEVYHLSKSS